ncbi:MAG TPA: hypothetical protein VII60_03590 [Acidimicrobiales bacterium]
MNSRIKSPMAAVGAAVASAALMLSVAVASPSGASSMASAAGSAFCTTIFTFHPAVPPASTNLKSYQAWAKSLEPLYATLASEAPNAASKSVLNAVVTVLKDYISSKSIPKLDAYIVANRAKWTKGTKALAAAIISCAKSLG